MWREGGGGMKQPFDAASNLPPLAEKCRSFIKEYARGGRTGTLARSYYTSDYPKSKQFLKRILVKIENTLFLIG